MKKKDLKCVICGSRIVYNENTQNFKCSECNADHTFDMFKTGKKERTHYRLTKIGIIIAILATLYVLYFFIRRIT